LQAIRRRPLAARRDRRRSSAGSGRSSALAENLNSGVAGESRTPGPAIVIGIGIIL